jgi:hypothetical protein
MVEMVRILRWTVAVVLIAAGLLALVFTDWCVAHDVAIPTRGQWGRPTTHGQVVWQGVLCLVLGLVCGPLRSLNDWIEDRRALNRTTR